jgi:ATP-dependent RNA helicase DDX51/DBP6
LFIHCIEIIRYESEDWKGENNHVYDQLPNLLKQIAERRRQKKALEAAPEPKVENVPAKPSVSCDEATEKKISKRVAKKRKRKDLSITLDTENKDILKKPKVKSEKDLSETLPENFTILGRKKRLKSQLVKRVLPYWLTHPEVVSSNLNNSSDINEVESLLDHKLVEKLKEDGFKKLFPVQVHLLSWLLKCDKDYNSGKWVRDSCVCMPTGSGKFFKQ